MSPLLKLGVGTATLALAALALLADPQSSWAEDVALCKPTGCPTGTQLCATINAGIPGVGAITYYCYQSPPAGSSDPKQYK